MWLFFVSVAFSVVLWIVIKPAPRTQRLDPGFEALIQKRTNITIWKSTVVRLIIIEHRFKFIAYIIIIKINNPDIRDWSPKSQSDNRQTDAIKFFACFIWMRIENHHLRLIITDTQSIRSDLTSKLFYAHICRLD